MISSTSHASTSSDRVLVLASTAQDATFSIKILHEHAIGAKVCINLAQFCAEVSLGAAVGLVAEEHLLADGNDLIAEMLQSQANWSDFPLIVLLGRGAHSSDALHRLQTLGNVTLVTRPIRISTFLNTIRAKLRDRKRQYAVRDLLVERGAANEVMRRDEQRLSMALNAAKMAVWEWREKSPYWSDSLYELLGFDRHVQPSTERFMEYVIPVDRSFVESEWKRSIENHVPFAVEFCILRKNGQRRWLAGCGEPALDASGKLVRFSGLIWDITDRKKFERREKRSAVSERFLAEATLLLSSSLDNEVHTRMLARSAEKNLNFTVEFAGKIPQFINSDEKRLRQIMINLIGNAIKFTQVGSVRVIVSHVQPSDHDCIRFDVIDTGIGMSEEQISRLFHPFAQGDASLTRSFGGTGLGLAISSRLARMLGGDICVTSHPGRSSHFTCTINTGNEAPVELINPIDHSSTHNSSQNAKPSPLPELYCRVLVVDDRRDVRFLTRHLLVKSGAEVESVEDGIEAIEAINRTLHGERPFDLILLDMQMPRLDGYATAARLRAMGYEKPIIALTADAMHGDIKRCLENGYNAYLSKPINAEELLSVVARHVGQRVCWGRNENVGMIVAEIEVCRCLTISRFGERVLLLFITAVSRRRCELRNDSEAGAEGVTMATRLLLFNRGSGKSQIIEEHLSKLNNASTKSVDRSQTSDLGPRFSWLPMKAAKR